MKRAQEQNIPCKMTGKGRERSEGVRGNVIVNDNPPIKTKERGS